MQFNQLYKKLLNLHLKHGFCRDIFIRLKPQTVSFNFYYS